MWNVAGVKNVREAWSVSEKYYIIILQETWVGKSNEKKELGMLSKNYEWKLKEPVREKGKNNKYNRGRAKGGQIVGIRKTLCKE